MSTSSFLKKVAEKRAWIVEFFFFLAFFGYTLVRIQPGLAFEHQQSAFLCDRLFFLGYAQIPGGVMDWFSALCAQFFAADWASSLAITSAAWLITILTRRWIGALRGGEPVTFVHLFPAVFLLALHSRYMYPFAPTLNLLGCLALACLVEALRIGRGWIRFGVSLSAAVLLYWFSGGTVFLFSAMVGLSEILLNRRIAWGILLLLGAAILPVAASASIFLVGTKAAFLHGLALENVPSWGWPAYALAGFYVLAPAAVFLATLPWFRKPMGRIPPILKWTAGLVLVLAAAGFAVPPAADGFVRLSLRVKRDARLGRWDEVLRLTRDSAQQSEYLSFQHNRALSHTGQLLDLLFVRPQAASVDALLPDNALCFSEPEDASDFFFDLGLVAESQHWTHEAFAVLGPTPPILKRLAQIYLLKSEPAAASVFLETLKRSPTGRAWALEALERASASDAIGADGVMYTASRRMPSADYISLGQVSGFDLETLLRRNPENKTAFEYLMALHLIRCNHRAVYERLADIDRFYALEMPRLLQEAVLLHAAFTQGFDFKSMASRISPAAFGRFREYRNVLAQYGNNPQNARQALQEQFGGTYWFHCMFNRPQAAQSGGPR